MNIAVVGTGYVGLVSGTCFAEVGHTVTCIDVDQGKIDRLNEGIIPIYEPGLEALVQSNHKAGRLSFSTDLADVIDDAEVVMIAVGTPSRADGHADMQYVHAVATQIGELIKDYTVVVNKSTVPVGTGREVEKMIKQNYDGDFDVVSCPEFLREGCAVEDFMKPDRVVIGARTDRAEKVMLDMFEPIKGEKVVTTVESAELIKYASNAFLATKISFINEIGHICERAGADIEEVAYGIGLDNRIGPRFLKAGIGWGGSCFPKDVQALDQMAGIYGYDFQLLKAVIGVNNHQRKHMIEKVKKHFDGSVEGKTIGVLGIAFKSNTDDIRESAAIDIIQLLREEGATVRTFDYQAMEHGRAALGEDGIMYADDPYGVAEGVDALVVATEWDEFTQLDWGKMKDAMSAPVLFDGRNILKPERMREQGFVYYSIGRNHETV